MMITLLKAGEGQLWEARPLCPGLHVLHMPQQQQRQSFTHG